MAVKPGTQYLGVAILEGEELIGYSVKTFPSRKDVPNMRLEVQQYLTKVFQRYEPSMLVIEQPIEAEAFPGNSLSKLASEIKNWGKWKGLNVRSYCAPAVKAFFCRDAKTKQSLAEALIDIYPVLTPYLSVFSWKRRYWFHVFDAVGLGLMCQRKLAR
jgi:hypothetical protein